MDVKAVSINQVFLGNRILKIPFFQRGYVWNESNWKQFFDDLTNIAGLINEKGVPEVYFLGSIIIKDAGRKGKQQFDVIDGQQRLTTIVLFMKALCLALNRNDLFNSYFMQTSLFDEIKPILITNYNNQQVYNKIINLEIPQHDKVEKNSRMADAFAYFTNRINEVRYPTDGTPAISPETLFGAVMDYVRLVCIEVQSGENAQKIFETINCTGIKLTTGEMLKNFLFDETKVGEYERTWKQVFENKNNDYWERELTNGRLSGSHIENFFYRYMLIKMQEPEIKKGLTLSDTKSYRQMGGQFEKFRNLINKFNISKEDAVKDIVKYAQIYLNIFKPETLDEVCVQYPGIERLAYLMFMQNTWTMTPYILYLVKNVESECERNRIFSYLEIYLIRRIICKSKNNNYSDMFSENLIGQHVDTYDAFKAYVNNTENRGALLMPSDEEVVEAVKTKDLKRDSYIILYMLESRINSKFYSSDRNNDANTFVKEQVMLEKDNGNWPSANGYSEEQRQMLTKTLGNFAIIREKLKTKFKNAKWSDKRKAMKLGSSDMILGRIFTQGQRYWDESVIEKRNLWLAEKILEAWPR
mgnify:FL=1